MLQVVLTYDGNSLLIFKQEDILNIRMTTLYSWLTDSDFNINLQDVLGLEPGLQHVIPCLPKLFLFLSELPIFV